MQWSRQQEEALRKVKEWFGTGEPLFKLFGYAGTGKTTLAKQIAQDVGGFVMFGAYTGKAAYVLKQKGCGNAQTIHSMIYHTGDKSKERLLELKSKLAQLVKKLHDESGDAVKVGANPELLKLKRRIAKEEEELSKPFFMLNFDSSIKDANLVIIDECSMVGKQMGQDLLSFGVPILVLGDPAQLPPVGDGGFFTNGKPHHMLTEIHRQAEDNPIIRIATKIRKGKGLLPLGSYGQSQILSKGDITPELAQAADQILVGRNKTRRVVNRRIRELRGQEDNLPVDGDKLVCLRNNYDLGLLNGSLWRVDRTEAHSKEYVDLLLSNYDFPKEFEPVDTIAHACIFHGLKLTVPWWDRKLADEFDYGYALTCHKAQGSQWENVFVFNEGGAFGENADRWLYTAVTRASEKVTIVRDY